MTGLYAPDGSIRIKEDDSRTGAFTADGAWRVEEKDSGPFVTSSGARRKDMVQQYFRTTEEGNLLQFSGQNLTYNGEILVYGN